ncbi:MAG: ATPase, partial [Bdellovibrio sp.]
MILRTCKLPKKNSFFLFGPRGSGKSTLLQSEYSEDDSIFLDLLDVQLLDDLMIDAGRFEQMINARGSEEKRVIIDEIQKFPRLLDLVQKQIQRHKRQFILTGSSARKLKQSGTNLLAGRAWLLHLYPFTANELADRFDLKLALERGTLPDAYLASQDSDAREYLLAYVANYLEKEIQQERWVRNLVPFRRFLAIAAQMNGKIINHLAIAREVGVNDVTVANYFEILEDTLLGFQLPAFHKSVRKAQKQAPKFYFIDPGIKRALDRSLSVDLLPQTYAWGDAFEHWVILEIFKNASYDRLDWEFSFLRTKDDLEIDLIIDRPGQPPVLVEIKSKQRVQESDTKSLQLLGPDIHRNPESFLLSMDPLEARFGKVRALRWDHGLDVIFGREHS